MKITHIVIIFLTAVSVTLFGVYKYTENKYQSEIKNVSNLLENAVKEKTECLDILSKQSAAIEKVKVDTVEINKEITKVVTKYSILRDSIKVEMQKDDTQIYYQKQHDVAGNLLRNWFEYRLSAAGND